MNELELLDDLARAQGEGDWARVEVLTYEMHAVMRPELVGPVLALLADDDEHDVQMFGLVHLAETVEDEPYLRSLLAVLGVLSGSAPEWARTLVIRVLNSPAAYQVLMHLLGSISPDDARSLTTVAGSIERWNPGRFDSQLSEIRAGLRIR